MGKKKNGDMWMAGRTRHVRVYLTDEEHALVRAAAAHADRPLSRFSVEAIVEKARRVLASIPPPGPPPEPPPEEPSSTPKRRKPGRPPVPPAS